MCSRLEDDDDDASTVIPKAKPSLTPDRNEKTCMKCKAEPSVVIARTKDPMCGSCFDVYFAHRFRATFGKTKLVRQGEKVLVAFSGGPSSRSMLDLIEKGLLKESHKKLRFIPTVLFIDESGLYQELYQESTSLLSIVLSIASLSPFSVYYISLEEVIGDSSSKACSLDKLMSQRDETNSTTSPGATPLSAKRWYSPSDIDKELSKIPQSPNRKKLYEYFNTFQSLTAKEDVLISLRRKLFMNVAVQLGMDKILTGDSATRLSVRLMSNVCQGRGHALPLDIGFCDDRENVHILRPMREFLESEISAYISLHKLETVLLPKLASVSPDTNSIDNLTESLLRSLQSEFPSTVNTVFRTGDKLQMNESLTQSKLKCLQCLAPYSMELDETIFTHLQSGMDSLCYGCRLTMRDKEDFNSFLFQKEFQS